MAMKECTCSAATCKYILTVIPQPFKTTIMAQWAPRKLFHHHHTYCVVYSLNCGQNETFTPTSDPYFYKIIGICCSRECFSLLACPVLKIMCNYSRFTVLFLADRSGIRPLCCFEVWKDVFLSFSSAYWRCAELLFAYLWPACVAVINKMFTVWQLNRSFFFVVSCIILWSVIQSNIINILSI